MLSGNIRQAVTLMAAFQSKNYVELLRHTGSPVVGQLLTLAEHIASSARADEGDEAVLIGATRGLVSSWIKEDDIDQAAVDITRSMANNEMFHSIVDLLSETEAALRVNDQSLMDARNRQELIELIVAGMNSQEK